MNSADLNHPVENLTARHTEAIGHLKVFIAALDKYVLGAVGANADLQLAMRPLRMPSCINMRNAMEWAVLSIEKQEKALAFEIQKGVALAVLKEAERQSRQADRLAQRARKAWTLLLKAPNIASSVIPLGKRGGSHLAM